jgi:hypothetical protein
MTRTRWIIALVGAGVVLAILIGVLGTRNEESSQAEAVSGLCSSLSDLDSTTSNLTSLSPATASKDDYDSAVSDVQDAWDEVKSDAGEVESTTMSQLDSAWDSFTSAVQNVPSDASASDALQSINQSAQQLASSTKSTLSAVNCS